MSEFLGTAILVGLGCMGCASTSGKGIVHMEVVFSFAFAVATAVMVRFLAFEASFNILIFSSSKIPMCPVGLLCQVVTMITMVWDTKDRIFT